MSLQTPRSFWKFDEASGTRADEMGINDFLEVGSPPIPSNTGIRGNACDITPLPIEHFELASTTELGGGDRDFTIMGWVFFDDITVNRRIISKWNSIQGRDWVVHFQGPPTNKIRFQVRDSDDLGNTLIDSGVAISISTWYFFCARHDSVNNLIRLRVNGTDATPVAFTGGTNVGATKACAGSLGRNGSTTEDSGSILDGRIDHIGFWPEHLSDADVAIAFGGGEPPGFPFPGSSDSTKFRDNFYPWERAHDVGGQKLIVTSETPVGQGSRLSVEQILGDCWNRSTGKLRVAVDAGAPSATIVRLSPTLILQKVHDPGAQALRIRHNGASVAAGSRLSFTQLLQQAFDPVNNVLRASAFLSSGGVHGSRLSPEQVLQDVYDSATGIRMSL